MSKKSSILGSSMFNFIANIATKNVKLTDTTTDESVKSDTDKEHMELSDEESIRKTELLASNFRMDLRLSKESDSEGNSLHSEQILSVTKEEIFDMKKIEEIDEIQSKFEFKLLSKAEKEFATESHKFENITKGCKWSPDGTCLLTNSEDKTLRIFDLNNEMLNPEEQTVNEISPSLKMTEPEIIYDYAWYPYMNSHDPLTACIFSTCKDNPVHLFDAYTGKIRCSYKGYNHLDELESAYSIAFDSTASKIYCGYNKCIKIFDIATPGKNFQDIKLKDDQYKMPGIISCIAFSKAQNGIYAAGSYTKFIGIFIETTNEPVCLIQTHRGGLTHLMFSSDGNRLYSGARKDSDIYCWDIRNPGKLLQIFKRDVTSNQRIYFDLYKDCKYLASGNNNGSVSFWNGQDFDISQEDEPLLYSLNAHNDCVNGLSFHPSLNLMATTSGERKNFNFMFDNNSSDDESDTETQVKNSEISLKIWKHFL
ncbi:unnamed protein product [Brachionus calyciflorus]|uniref:WD repeat-containing protein 79 n=1 Tax=Brachionus calyciflorus TaxID=104777 RepID=A0A813T9X1_9BILA|nr:unnamed protein product [Brachionus calyciflorus]